jgi:hypothetical protein
MEVRDEDGVRMQVTFAQDLRHALMRTLPVANAQHPVEEHHGGRIIAVRRRVCEPGCEAGVDEVGAQASMADEMDQIGQRLW